MSLPSGSTGPVQDTDDRRSESVAPSGVAARGADCGPQEAGSVVEGVADVADEEFFDGLDLAFDLDAATRPMDAALLPAAPDPYLLAELMSAVFGLVAVSLRAVAVLSGGAPGRALAELEALRGLRALEVVHPGFYRRTAIAVVAGPGAGEAAVSAARRRAEGWFLASARAASSFLPGLPAPVTGLAGVESDPVIVDVFSALSWFEQARPTLVHLARGALGEGRHQAAIDLAASATPDAAGLGSCREAARVLIAAARAGGDVRAERCGLEHLAAALAGNGDLAGARRMLVTALSLAQRERDMPGLARLGLALGRVHLQGGDLVMARRWLKVSASIAERHGQQQVAARAHQSLADVMLRCERPRRVEALGLLANAGRRHLQAGDLAGYAGCARLIASAIRRRPGGDPALALCFAGYGVQAAEAAGIAGLSGYGYAEVGRCVEVAGYERAAKQWREMALLLAFHRAVDTRDDSALGVELDAADGDGGVRGAGSGDAAAGARRAWPARGVRPRRPGLGGQGEVRR
jgi:hypothetical protein